MRCTHTHTHTFRLPLATCLVAIGVAVLVGCQDDVEELVGGTHEAEQSEPVLGRQLENPYTVEAITRARDSLVAIGVLSKGQVRDEDLVATHYYVRLKPATELAYRQLKADTNLILWDFPLDYELPEGLRSYRDPAVPAGQPNYQYTVLPTGGPVPPVPCERLAALILKDGRKADVLGKFDALWESYDLLEIESLRLTGNAAATEPSLRKTAGWKPKGSIKVVDDFLGTVPVFGVQVRIRNWFRSWQGYTDVNGNFSSSQEFTGDVAYYVRWEYKGEVFDIRDDGVGQAYYNGPNTSWSNWNHVFSSGVQLFYAHIFRAGTYYVAQEPFGLDNTPFDYISIQAHDSNAPEGKNGDYHWGNENIDLWRKDQAGTVFDSRKLFGIAAHELAHAHHDDTYTGGSGYADINEKLRESWAEAIEGYFVFRVYAYQSLLKQSATFTWMRTTGEGKYTSLFIDLVDTNNQRFELSPWSEASDAPLDCVSGYTLPQIAECLGTATTLVDVKQTLKSRWDNPTEYFVEEFFSQFEHLYPAATPAIAVWQQGAVLPIDVPQYSPNTRYALIFQGDGNLVVYDAQASWAPVWHAGTQNKGGTHCVFQADGNLVIYGAQSQPLWASNTTGGQVKQLVLADNGLLAICPSPNAFTRFVNWAPYVDRSSTF